MISNTELGKQCNIFLLKICFKSDLTSLPIRSVNVYVKNTSYRRALWESLKSKKVQLITQIITISMGSEGAFHFKPKTNR